MNIFRCLRAVANFSTQALRTEIFHTMSDRTLATPELVRRHLLKRIPFHSPLSQVSLYHGKRIRHAVKSCFSEKKTKKFKKVNKIKKQMWSDVLGVKLYVRMSNKAYRCIKKVGSFDRYILLTHPKKLDSKIGEYYRTLMMRKINDPEYRVPYVLGSGRKKRIRQFQRYQWIKQGNRIIIPKDFRQKFLTYQRKFGTSVDQFNEEDYQKYLEVEKLKKLWGRDVDTKHPLLLEIKSKLEITLSDDEIAAMEEKAEEYKRAYLEHPRKRHLRQKSYEYNEREAEKDHLRLKEAWIKHQSYEETDAGK